MSKNRVGTVALGFALAVLATSPAAAAWNESCTKDAFSVTVTEGVLRAKCKGGLAQNVTDSLNCCDGLQILTKISDAQRKVDIMDGANWLNDKCINKRVSNYASSVTNSGAIVWYLGCVDPDEDDPDGEDSD